MKCNFGFPVEKKVSGVMNGFAETFRDGETQKKQARDSNSTYSWENLERLRLRYYTNFKI